MTISELSMLDHKDRWTPADYARARELTMPGATIPTTYAVARLTDLRETSRKQWAAIKATLWHARQAAAAERMDSTPRRLRRAAALRKDAGWQLEIWAETRRRIAEVEARLVRQAGE